MDTSLTEFLKAQHEQSRLLQQQFLQSQQQFLEQMARFPSSFTKAEGSDNVGSTTDCKDEFLMKALGKNIREFDPTAVFRHMVRTLCNLV